MHLKKMFFLFSLIGLGWFAHDSKGQTQSADTLEQFLLRQLKNKKNVSYATYGLAALYFDRGNYRQAIAIAKENLRITNDFDTACSVLYARSLEMIGRYSKAEKVFRKATTRFANSSDVWLAYGFTLYKLRKYTQAERALETSVRLNPFVPSAHYLLGYCLLENKNNPACIQAWLFGLMIDRDTLRSNEMLRLIFHYVQQQYDSIHLPFFNRRLSLKYPDQLFLYDYTPQRLENFNFQLNIASFVQLLAEKMEPNPTPSLYSRFYRAIYENNLQEPFCYFALRNLNRRALKSWYAINREKLEQLADFLDHQLVRPF